MLYFLKISGCGSPEGLLALKATLRQVGAVREGGSETAADPEAGWVVVESRLPDSGSVRGVLDTLGLNQDVSLVEPVREIVEGRRLARQLSLF